MLIIVLVALNRSPIENGLTTVGNESATAAVSASEDPTLTNLALTYSIRSAGSLEVTEDISMQAMDCKRELKGTGRLEIA